MDFDKVATLLQIAHSSLGFPRLNGIYVAAMRELEKINDDSVRPIQIGIANPGSTTASADEYEDDTDDTEEDEEDE